MVSLDITLVYLIVLFCILMIFLQNVAFKPTLNLMEERRKRIYGRFEKAKKLEEEGEEILRKYEESIKSARDEGIQRKEALIAEARRIYEEEVSSERRKIGEELPKRKEEVFKSLEEEMKLVEKEMEGIGKKIAETLLGRSLE